MRWVVAFVLIGAAVALAGCFDQPDWVQVTNQSAATGEATVSFRSDDGAITGTRTITLGNHSVERFTVELTSDVRYTAEVVIGERILTSDRFHTGTGEWRVYVMILDDGLRVSTLHGD